MNNHYNNLISTDIARQGIQKSFNQSQQIKPNELLIKFTSFFLIFSSITLIYSLLNSKFTFLSIFFFKLLILNPIKIIRTINTN